MLYIRYGYCRCSTNEKKQDIDRQKRELTAEGAEIIFFEYEHRDKADKKELNKLLDITKQGDEIIVTEISRLASGIRLFLDILDTVQEKHLKLVIKNSITVDCTNGVLDPMTSAFCQMGAVFSELELNMTRALVRSGMANAAAKGVKLGRRETTKDDIPEVFYRHYPAYKAGQFNASEMARLCNISRPTFYKYLRLVETTE